ncbi:MAG TPA: proton-conducting transporter membrane subunit, partial [Planctomycetota bacterium]|nr:proton-conducting transporter membrane subunit [Planctomycetota bacterium]
LILGSPLVIGWVRIPGASRLLSGQLLGVGLPALAAGSLILAYSRLGDTRLLSGALRLEGLGVFGAVSVMLLAAASSVGVGQHACGRRSQLARGSLLTGQVIAVLTGDLFITALGLTVACVSGPALLDPLPPHASSKRHALRRLASSLLPSLGLFLGAGLLYAAVDQHNIDSLAQGIFQQMLSVRRGLSSLPHGLTAGFLLWVLGLILASGGVPVLQWDPDRRQGVRSTSVWLCGSERVVGAILLYRWVACFAFSMQESHGVLLAVVAMLGVGYAALSAISSPRISASLASLRRLQTSMILVLVAGAALLLPRSRGHVAHFHSGSEAVLLQVFSDSVLWAGLLILLPSARLWARYTTHPPQVRGATRVTRFSVVCLLMSLAGLPGTLGGLSKVRTFQWMQQTQTYTNDLAVALTVLFAVGTVVQFLVILRVLATFLEWRGGFHPSRIAFDKDSPGVSTDPAQPNRLVAYGLSALALAAVFLPLWTELLGLPGRELVVDLIRLCLPRAP